MSLKSVLRIDFVIMTALNTLYTASFPAPAVTLVWRDLAERLMAWAGCFNDLFDVPSSKGVDLLTVHTDRLLIERYHHLSHQSRWQLT